MLKIGIVCYPSVGGSGIVATELGKMLAKKGHEIHFITSSVPFRLDSFYPNIYFHEVEMNHYPVFQYPPYDFTLANKIAEVIESEKLDIIHAHYAIPHAICAILAKQIAKHPVKIVTTLHGTDITVLGIDLSLKKIIEFGIQQSDAVTAVSESLVNQTQEMLDIQKEIQVIYNFVIEDEYSKPFHNSFRERYNINAEEKIIVHISNFRKVKRVEDVVVSFQKILNKTPARLLLVGDGPEYSRMKALTKELGINEKVHFLGKQKDIPMILADADLLLLLSEKESFGLVLLEAMIAGVPCIATEVGGIPEVIEHNETGFIVPLGDTDATAEYAYQLLSNTSTWKQFSEAANQSVYRKFASEKIGSQYEALYERVLGETND
ncbi:N-acetyl-alpha-D-glucosaminyl L-malate synthase BshA [Gracilibacillus halotolerans]|uniref:N-acetyl-alpha-D-glucosaminyl L-malate synthase BshA n=1 Tax=Gracilibacillus halotolerans TaxID=74386 RepID=A0A841RHX3_9BACI|nr:N-acetyl-alpha-D-glucosaminyl L-malate synthase BshA [Gracilibacillus halotolerans]MBB6511632.1 N-acetyl-alpha-D-glucosaminyl L-malate synthase BshA [Gracilibacillus halotolerans]